MDIGTLGKLQEAASVAILSFRLWRHQSCEILSDHAAHGSAVLGGIGTRLLHDSREIATQLDISLESVKSHVKVILEKLEVSSRTEAAAIAQRKNLLKQ